MHTLMDAVRYFDVQFYYFLSQAHGNWIFDRLALHQESNTLLKSGVFVAMYWYFWFRTDGRQDERRRTILTTVLATLAGLVAARAVASVAPYRIRPMYDGSLQHHALSVPIPTDFVNWSSFPSDHAAYLAALGFGLMLLSRRLAVPVSLYVAGWICFPRLYLGIHFASDIVVGVGIGVASVWFALRSEWVDVHVAGPLLTYVNARPQVFYPAAFLILFEMATLFWDIREPVHAILHAASVGSRRTVIGDGFVLLAALAGIGLVVMHRVQGRRRDKAVPQLRCVEMPGAAVLQR